MFVIFKTPSFDGYVLVGLRTFNYSNIVILVHVLDDVQMYLGYQRTGEIYIPVLQLYTFASHLSMRWENHV